MRGKEEETGQRPPGLTRAKQGRHRVQRGVLGDEDGEAFVDHHPVGVPAHGGQAVGPRA